MNRDTICVQGGYTPGNGEPRQIPIIQSTTFKYATSEDMGKLFDLEAEGYFYSRLQNPTCDHVAAKNLRAGGRHRCHADLHPVRRPTSSPCSTSANAGDHIVASSTIYGGTFNLISVTMKKMGIDCYLCGPPDCTEEELNAAFRPNTKAVFGETIANPALTVLDIEKFAKAAHAHGVPLDCGQHLRHPGQLPPLRVGGRHRHPLHHQVYGRPRRRCWAAPSWTAASSTGWPTPDKFPGLCTPDDSYHGITYAERFGKEGAFITKCHRPAHAGLRLHPVSPERLLC